MRSVIQRDPGILAGEPVFVGTRVPARALIDHIASGISIETFLEDFPTVRSEQVVAFLAELESAQHCRGAPLPSRTPGLPGSAESSDR